MLNKIIISYIIITESFSIRKDTKSKACHIYFACLKVGKLELTGILILLVLQ